MSFHLLRAIWHCSMDLRSQATLHWLGLSYRSHLTSEEVGECSLNMQWVQQIPRVIFATSTPLVPITVFLWQVENMHLLSVATNPKCYPVTANSSDFRISRRGVGLPISCGCESCWLDNLWPEGHLFSSSLESDEGSGTFSIRKRKKRRQSNH